jgi:hypothetical protein
MGKRRFTESIHESIKGQLSALEEAYLLHLVSYLASFPLPGEYMTLRSSYSYIERL